MTSISASMQNDGEPEGPESITDIQNYLQSFNREIGEDGTPTNGNPNTFYQLDAQVSFCKKVNVFFLLCLVNWLFLLIMTRF